MREKVVFPSYSSAIFPSPYKYGFNIISMWIHRVNNARNIKTKMALFFNLSDIFRKQKFSYPI